RARIRPRSLTSSNSNTTAFTDSGERMRAVKTILAFVRLTVTHLVTTLWSTLVQCVRFVESWLLDTRKARYGIAVTRMLLGLSAFGLLLSNFTTRLYSFGSGSVWNGEAEEPKSD